MRIPRLRGGGSLLKCPKCRLKCLPAAAGPKGSCPRCGHEPLLKMDIERGWLRRGPQPHDDSKHPDDA